MNFLAAVLIVAVPAIVAFCVWRAIVSARTPQGAVAWTVFLIASPWFAVPSYVLFGRSKLKSYTESRRDSRNVIEQLHAFGQAHPRTDAGGRNLQAFETLAQMPMVRGNSVELLINGQATFAAIFAAIDAATDYVCVQFYTIADDDLGTEMAEHLIAASARGVTVRVIYDGAGSYWLSRAYRKRLLAGGVQVLDPREGRGPSSKLDVNFRNHRKTVVVDGITGFTGGHNVADLYMGRGKFDPWRDTHLKLRGPMVTQLQLAFAEDWHWALGGTLGDALNWSPEHHDDDIAGQVISTGPGDVLDSGAQFYMAMIAEAHDRIWIASPYFVPDMAILSALINAALRGLDVRILVPRNPDHYLTWLAAFDYFDDARAAGVRIYAYDTGFTHQKVILVDDDLAAVGTMNLDNRSFRLNFETMALIEDADFADQVSRMLSQDYAAATLVDMQLSDRPLWIRIGAPLAHLLAPIL